MRRPRRSTLPISNGTRAASAWPCCCTAGRTARSAGTRWRQGSPRTATACSRPRCAVLPRPAFAMRPCRAALAALGRDLLDFVDALGLERPVLVGHDWGARAAANACGLHEGAASHLVMLSVGYGTNDPGQPLSLQQARNYWYHWFMATRAAAGVARRSPRVCPPDVGHVVAAGLVSRQRFRGGRRRVRQADWIDVVLHSYRHRWGFAPGTPAYADDDARLNPAPVLALPTLVLHGGADTCNHPDSSAGRERFFAGATRGRCWTVSATFRSARRRRQSPTRSSGSVSQAEARRRDRRTVDQPPTRAASRSARPMFLNISRRIRSPTRNTSSAPS